MTVHHPCRLSPADILTRALAGLFPSNQIEVLLDRLEGKR
jgi:hypothetical protein